MKTLRLLLVLSTLLLIVPAAQAQMPPHPDLLNRLERGQQAMPYVLEHRAALQEKGIDAPWGKTPSRSSQNLLTGEMQRTLGPELGPTGSWKALLILVQFSDKPAQVVATSFDNLIFGAGSGTMRDYFRKVSYNTLDVITVNLPSTIAWQSAAQTYAYYCNAQNGLGAYPQNTQHLVEDVVQMVNPTVDFSQYDNDGNGTVDALFIVHAGPGAEYTGSGNDIWSHAWSTYYTQYVDGVAVSRYSTEPEYWSTPGDMTIGVYAHELGHAAFGLPDLYDTDGTSEGLGRWSLMASGSWNGTGPGGNYPAFPDAYTHIQMGYALSSTVATNVNSVPIANIENNQFVYRLWTDGAAGSQYFLVENRQMTGYDTYLPGSGLAIFHVDEAVSSNQNEWYPGHTASGHYKVALEQADGNWNLEKKNNRGDAGDSYPGSSGKTSFSASTVPDSKNYSAVPTNVAVLNISASALTMTADFQISGTTGPYLQLLSPIGGEVWETYSTKQITWDASGFTGTLHLEYTTDNGSSWTSIGDASAAPPAAPGLDMADRAPMNDAADVPARAPSGAGSFAWTIPVTPSAQCLVRIKSMDYPALQSSSNSSFTIIAAPPGIWSVQFNYDAATVTGAGGNAGVVFLPSLHEFWTTRWASNVLHRWNSSGALLGTFTVTGVTGIRGLAFDGTSVYAALNSTTLAIINPTTRALTGSITAPVTTRFVAYDPSAENGAGGFWVGNFSTALYLINRSGTVLRTLPYASLGSTSNYGAAFDPFSAGGPYIWLFGQGSGAGTPQRVVQVRVSDGLPTGLAHDVAIDFGVSAGGSPIAGGLFVATGIVSGKATLGGILQGAPDRLFGYQLCEATPTITLTAPTGGEFLKTATPTTISWTSAHVTAVHVDYSTNGGTTWASVAPHMLASDALVDWTPGLPPSGNCMIRVVDMTNSTIGDTSGAFTVYAPLPLSAKVILQGPYSSALATMTQSLYTAGILTSHFDGISIPADAVDSITVEVRDAPVAADATVRRFVPAWVSTGGVISLFNPGGTALSVDSLLPGSYYLAIHHRNHLAVMSANAVALSIAGAAYDFTTGLDKYYGGEACLLAPGVYGMWAGDADASGDIAASDRTSTWNSRNQTGYLRADVDLSGDVSAGDRTLTWNSRNKSSKVP